MNDESIFIITPATTLDFSARLQKEKAEMYERMQMRVRQEESYQQKRNAYFERGKDVYINPITIQFSDKQVELIEALTNEKGVSKSSYLRVIIERHLRSKQQKFKKTNGAKDEQNAQ